MIIPLIVTLFSFFALSAPAAPQHHGDLDSSALFVIPFHLNKPDAVTELPRRLVEISGLGVNPEGNLVAVQDEAAVLYMLDPENGTVDKEIRFGTRGDFEGVEFYSGKYYALRSDGTLFIITLDGDKVRTRKVSMHLGRGCDAEGLVADILLHRMLILCKESAGVKIHNARAIYAFDLSTEKTRKTPWLLLPRDRLRSSLQISKSEFGSFKPSAVAIHPTSGHLYIISSVDRRLIVVTRRGVIIGQHKFKRKDLRQPEGLAFGADGSLFIASEGAGRRGTITRFKPVVSEDDHERVPR